MRRTPKKQPVGKGYTTYPEKYIGSQNQRDFWDLDVATSYLVKFLIVEKDFVPDIEVPFPGAR